MEYLLDPVQIESAIQVLDIDLTQDELEFEIESLRTAVHRLQFSGTVEDVDPDVLFRRAYLLATLVSNQASSYEVQVASRALTVAALIFEYGSQLTSNVHESMDYVINAILFYSRGEQEAQSATLARRIVQSNAIDAYVSGDDKQESWRLLFKFLGREFATFLTWGRDSSGEFLSRIVSAFEEGPFWSELLFGCLDVTKSLVWGVDLNHVEHFNNAINQARSWGDSHLTWLGLTIKEVAENMIGKSLRFRLLELGVPGWAAETLTMDGFTEMWIPHREAFKSIDGLENGILSNESNISLINMPTSAGKSLVAEIAILHELIKNPECKAIWVVPSKALVYEVQSRLRTHLRRIGINVSSIPGGIETDPEDEEILANARVFVLTPEKLDGLLRRNPLLTDSVNMVVIDETHKIGEGGRGWLFETIIAWLLLISENNVHFRLIFMSASIPNRADFEVWLGQNSPRFISSWSSWRPTRLALFLTSGIGADVWTTKLIQRHSQDIIATHNQIRRPRLFDVPLFLLNTIYTEMDHSGSTLVFFYTKDDVSEFANQLSQVMTEEDPIPAIYEALSAKFAAIYGEDHSYTTALKRGIGIDHGDIPLSLRHLVERAFRNEKLPILVANQAVLEGVNFPIENIIIGSLGSREGRNFRFRLTPLDYSNLVGRVGRAMVNTEGNCFLVWNWFYERAENDDTSWDKYSSPVPRIEDINSTLAIDETVLVSSLQHLTSSLEGVDESAFDGLAVPWRDRLERLHSSALAILEHFGSEDYSHLSRWIQRTFAWQNLGSTAKEALVHYTEYAWRGYQTADRTLYRLASLSGLSVRSAAEIQRVAQQIIDNWNDDNEPNFETIFTQEMFEMIVSLRECWRRRPVTYSGRFVPNEINHYSATSAWINGHEWTEVSRIICENYQRLHPKTLANIVATYVSQIFEYRLPWVLGALAVAVREMGGTERLCVYLEDLPAYVRYGLNNKAAITLSKLCRLERDAALILAQKFLEQRTERLEIKTWLHRTSYNDLREWLPREPDVLLRDLWLNLHETRERDWSLRRDGQMILELAGWTNYQWSSVWQIIQTSQTVEFTLRLEPENQFDPFAVAVDAVWGNERVHIGYIPASCAEEVTELFNWGRKIRIEIAVDSSTNTPQLVLYLEEVD